MVRLCFVLAVAAPSQVPSVESMSARLAAGRLVLDQIRFSPDSDGFRGENGTLLRQVARALNLTSGRFVVHVPVERGTALPPDTILTRRRATTALRALLGAGANPAHLVGQSDGAGPGSSGSVPVPPGGARIELIRVDTPVGVPNQEGSLP